jgi:hypothetical protein
MPHANVFELGLVEQPRLDQIALGRPTVGEEIERQPPKDETASGLKPLNELLQQRFVLRDDAAAKVPSIRIRRSNAPATSS